MCLQPGHRSQALTDTISGPNANGFGSSWETPSAGSFGRAFNLFNESTKGVMT
jgi:hypothetical protein